MSENNQREAVFPTRMALTNTKNRLKGAQTGHSLLAKKRDALMIRFRAILKKVEEAKLKMGKVMQVAAFSLAEVNYVAGDISYQVQESAKRPQLTVKAKQENVSGVTLPGFEIEREQSNEFSLTGLGRGGQKIQKCKETYAKAIETLVELASLQTAFMILDDVIRVTNRRVNAIEHVVLPKLENTIKYINSELDEMDREEFFRLKKIQSKKKKGGDSEQDTIDQGEYTQDQAGALMDIFLNISRICPNDTAKVTEASRNLADSLRTSERRDQLSCVEDILEALNLQFKQTTAIDDDISQLERLTQLYRVTANICLDSNTNRQKLIDADVDISALGVLKSLTPQQISSQPYAFMLRAAFGTLINLSQDYSPSQERLNNHDTLPIVVKFLNRRNIQANDSATAVTHSYIYEWGWRIVNNLLSTENAKIEPGSTEVDALCSWVEAFYSQSIEDEYAGLEDEDELQAVYEEDLSSLESATLLLETFAFDSEAARLLLAQEEKLDVLLSFAETRELPRALAASADQSSVEEWSKIYEECKAAVGKCVVGIASEDQLMSFFFDNGRAPFVQRMLRWLESDLQRLNISGTLAIGNLARSEENSIIAVKQFKIIPRLVQLLRDDDVKVSHASMCLLKNLSLPASNKDEIGDSGAMEAAQKFLSLSFSHVQPLQFATVGFYKHLFCNTLTIVNHEPSILDSVLVLISKSDDAGVKSEGTRILVHGIKSCWISAGEKAQYARSKFTSHPVAKALVELLCNYRRYQILINEAVMGLTLLASERKGADYILAETSKLAPAIKQVLEDEKEINKKVKLNVCILYSNLVLKQTQENSNAKQLKGLLEQDIKSLCDDSDNELSKTASTVLFNKETAGALTSVLSDTDALQIQSIGKSGLTFSDGKVCKGPVIVVDNKIFLWKVPTPTMPFNWGDAIPKEAFKMFETLTPRPEILLLGTGKSMLPPPPAYTKYLNSLGIQVDIIDTKNACSTYNVLVEEDRSVAAALFPIDGYEWTKK
ncbi:hypothetical protein E3P92_01417 [Wallemia ichthyophaga]|nr:hypothetical protein E3P92_01417 [Wallemia ichthyophaga]TIB36066.1 hypothetical protein E3P84_01117 [Wallemia ichthyophaga]TIB39062.1 hypothetical protein E3P83_03684 [Wallemia ichthyophaga]TIB62850.1 hypothetical protein E3P77_03742 [Wallemia ichthyophaga]